MSILNVVEENNENVHARDLKRGDFIFAKKVDTLFLYYRDHAQGYGFFWKNIFNGESSGGFQTIDLAISHIQKLGYKVSAIKNS